MRVRRAAALPIAARRSSVLLLKTSERVKECSTMPGDRKEAFVARAVALAYFERTGGVFRPVSSFERTEVQFAMSRWVRWRRGVVGVVDVAEIARAFKLSETSDVVAGVLGFPAASEGLEWRRRPAKAMISAAPPPKHTTFAKFWLGTLLLTSCWIQGSSAFSAQIQASSCA